jgi:predicted RNA methylase
MLLGVGKITVLRWENGSSKPSRLAAEKLEEIGFPRLEWRDTKQISVPRAKQLTDNAGESHGLNYDQLRRQIRQSLRVGKTSYEFDPAPYVVNGPEDQLDFFETLYALQETLRPLAAEEYARRLSLVAAIPDMGISTAQYALEMPRNTATHWNPNYGSHGWHRYVGRFPPHLVRAILNHFGARKHQVVLDPFVGSGTTAVEARLLGLKAIGIDICPLSCLISRTKSQFPTDVSPLESLMIELNEFYNESWRAAASKSAARALTYEDVLARPSNVIPEFANYKKWLTPEAMLGTSIVIEYAQRLAGFERDMVCCALSALMRRIGNVDVDVVRAEYRKTPRTNVNVLSLVNRQLRKMITDIGQTITSHDGLLSASEDVSIIEASLFDVEIEQESVDYVVTSPPYGIESLSYLRTHLLSYRCLHSILKRDPYEYDMKIVGSEYLRPNGHAVSSDGPAAISPTFSDFFSETSGTSSAAFDARQNMMMRFFDDMSKAAEAFHRWLKPRGRVAFVIGNKKLGQRVIPTDQIATEVFARHGLKLEQKITHKLKCNNTNSEVPWQERIIQDESVLLLRKA